MNIVLTQETPAVITAKYLMLVIIKKLVSLVVIPFSSLALKLVVF
jgi:hypothetical protein